jgi:proteic killer suppression protein
VIKTFADRHTAELYETGRAKRFPAEIRSGALRRLQYLESAVSVDDLKIPLSNRLHKLERDGAGQYSISVNKQWRICFRFVDGDAYDVELTDYH